MGIRTDELPNAGHSLGDTFLRTSLVCSPQKCASAHINSREKSRRFHKIRIVVPEPISYQKGAPACASVPPYQPKPDDRLGTHNSRGRSDGCWGEFCCSEQLLLEPAAET